MTQKLFCFGLGYCAKYLIRALRQQKNGWQFAGTYRRDPPPDIDGHFYDGSTAIPKTAFADATHMLISIPPQGDRILHHHRQAMAAAKNLKWVGYLSTTAVYGDCQGAWVDENTAPAPTSDRGRARLNAEQKWQELSAHIFRLGSIYGPERGHLANILSGKQKKIIKPGQYFSRIHVEDIARSLMASMNAPNPGRTFNLVDDLPANTPEVLDYICDILGQAPLPPHDIDTTNISPLMRSFYSENKRVRNDHMKRELGITLQYPTYEEGFKALINNL